MPRWYAQTLWLGSVSLVISEIGFVGEVTPLLKWGTALLVFLFGLEQWVGLRECRNWRSHVRDRALHLVVAVVTVVLMMALLSIESALGEVNKITLLLYGLVQGSIFTALNLRALRHQARLTALKLRPGWLFMGSFALIIILGMLMLKLPRAVVDGVHLSWLNALFTSTSAVCVTGLAVENTAQFFSPTGQIILLGLIQIGGLGIMTITFYLATMLFQGMSMNDRQLLGEMISEKHLAQVSHALRFIILFTFISEALGAVWLFFSLPVDRGESERVFQAVFHSVSAFCNAGFSTLPDGLADTWVQGNVSVQAAISTLVILGGLGSLVIRDSLAWLRAWVRRKRDPANPRARLRVHTRLVLWITFVLLFGGALAILASEFFMHSGKQNGGMLLTAFFHSMTARTAGFNTVDMGGLGAVSVHILMLLMLIGGSPGGTAGGMRTTVFAVSALHLWNQLRMIPHLVLFRRRLPTEVGGRALAVIVLTLAWLFVNFVILRQLQPVGTDSSLLFELISAFATVGLSLNFTSELTDAAKLLLILNMFIGRVGLLTVASTLIPAFQRKPLQHPSEDILLV